MQQMIVDARPCMYQEFAGRAEGDDILFFVHGSGGDSTVWKRMLSDGAFPCRSVCVDLPGHGGSPGPAFDRIAEAAGWLKKCIAQIHKGPCVLAGHSLGGAVAIQCAAAVPRKIRGLVCMSTGARLPVPEGYRETLSRDFPSAVRLSCANAYGASSATAALSRQGYEMLFRNGSDSLCRDMNACADFDGTELPGAVVSPVLVVCGSEDVLTPPSLSLDLCGRFLHGQSAIIQGAGHMLMQEKPAACRSLLNGFVKALQMMPV